ncbi:VIP peptides-like isoform X1 [Scyliorhinus canicula]|uniref:VIP peptides-like isoform X1 n=1 Tax=Scyliorhinus canicula TaxID=7830 RepID=UPI0018F5ABE8|nr:VIP peptides-like isoform X1 [Scyliorhinus canicula]XP_038672872.1 VIP peptides-like isoform X1 [Scyliorhinus canicula]
MVIRFSSHFVTLFILLNVLYQRGSGFPSLGTYSNLRLGNVGLDGQSDEDQSQSPGKADSDIYQSPFSDSDQLYYQLSQAIPRTTRHADGLFTSEYSKLLDQLSARKYLESLIGKRVSASNENIPVKRHSDAVFTDNYSRIRKQMAVKKYINSLLAGKRSQEDLNPANLSDTPPIVDNYDSVTVDEVLSQLPALNR